MTDSTLVLTESVIALGKTLGGRGQESDEDILARMDLLNKQALLADITARARDPKGRLDMDDIILMGQLKRELSPIPRKNRYKLGAREFTLTYSPKWFDDAEARVEMKKAIGKLIKYYKDKIIHLRAIGEVGTNGLSHVHCFYKLEGGVKITDKNFKRAWSHWDPTKSLGKNGFQGGHHADVKEESDFLGYIDKDIEGAWLEENIQS